MYTRNYWIAKAANWNNTTSKLYNSTYKNRPKYFKTVNGTEDTNTKYYSDSYKYVTSALFYEPMNQMETVNSSIKLEANRSNVTSTFGYGVAFGTGNAPVTIDDYKFSGETVTNFTVSSVYNHSSAIDGTETINTRTYTITNNNNFDITIGEVGFFAGTYIQTGWNSSSSSNVFHNPIYMLERTALENPITIPANGGVGQITYTIKMEYPVPPIEE